MEQSIELLTVLVIFLFASTYFYKKNYYIHIFLGFAVFWQGINVMIEFDGLITYPLILMIFGLLVGFFSIADNKKLVRK